LADKNLFILLLNEIEIYLVPKGQFLPQSTVIVELHYWWQLETLLLVLTNAPTTNHKFLAQLRYAYCGVANRPQVDAYVMSNDQAHLPPEA
jgi:hypothetical protein